MTAKQIKNLASASYTNNTLDAKKVNRICKLLNRTQLKRYIQFLRNLERSKTVEVVVSKLNVKNDLKGELRKIFSGKKLRFSEDKSLIAGLKLIDNDDIYDFNLKNTFENLLSYINR
jgi:F0F1-type ATP synthase delta subunit